MAGIGINQASRAISHTSTSPISGHPLSPGRPVQLGTAVNRNPAIMAAVKPNGISWRCQASMPPIGCAPGSRPYNHNAQTATAMAANPAPARKNGRKPREKTGAAAIPRITPPPWPEFGSARTATAAA
ncbi:hypothetical protein D9M69_490870 [compost metagenome]